MITKLTNRTLVKNFLIKNADAIQKLATLEHKKYLGGLFFRTELIPKYQKLHITILEQFAQNLEVKALKPGIIKFKILAEQLAREAVLDGLNLEETLDGTIFLKQAIWKKMDKHGLISKLSVKEYHDINLVIGTYSDVVASKIAFTFHSERQQIEQSLRYLAEASKLLASSLDYHKTLESIGKLAVPTMADWFTIDMLDKSGELQRITIAHKDPKQIKWARELQKEYPPDMNAPMGIPNVIRTGKSELYPDIPDEMLVKAARDKKQLQLLRKLGFSSAMIVPIHQQGVTVGGISFISTNPHRHYNTSDVTIAEELAHRASIAIENARLYSDSQKAISLRDEFISVASHELKTPVTSVKMFTQVLKHHSEQIGDTKAIQYLSTMDKQLNKLTELIYDLLNISKIQAGRMEYNLKVFNFDTSIKDIVDVLQQSAGNHKIIVKGETKKKIKGDEERIGQVVNNLVSNAIKYSPKAKEIIIHLTSDKESVTVGIQDFGVGMEKEHLVRIFERFYRVYDTNDKTFPGLGIGLYISAEIVKRHGGKLWVDSNLGKGSTFYFTLPVNGELLNQKMP